MFLFTKKVELSHLTSSVNTASKQSRRTEKEKGHEAITFLT